MIDLKRKIYKHNYLAELKGDLNLIELKLLNIMISKTTKKEKENGKFDLHKIKLTEIEKVTEKKIDYKKMKPVSANLKALIFSIEEQNEGNQKPNYINRRIFDKADYFGDEGALHLQLSEELAEYLMDFEGKYYQHELKYTIGMSSKFSVRLYELLKSYKGINKEKVSIDDLKEMLGIPNKYKAIKDFRKHVLNVAVNEINEKTNLKVSYELERTSRKYTHIIFTIEEFEIDESKVINYEDIGNWRGCPDFHGHEEKLINIAKEKIYSNMDPEEYIQQYFLYCMGKKNIKNIINYIENAMQKDYLNIAGQESMELIKQKRKERMEKEKKEIEESKNRKREPMPEELRIKLENQLKMMSLEKGVY